MKILRCILKLLKGNQIEQFNQQNTNRNHTEPQNHNQLQQLEILKNHDCDYCERFDEIKYIELNGHCIKLICQNCRNLRSYPQIFPVLHLQEKTIGVFNHFAKVLDSMNYQLRHINQQSREDILQNISMKIYTQRQRLLFCGINYQKSKLQRAVDKLIYRYEHLQNIQELNRYISFKEAAIQIEQFFYKVNTCLKINNLQTSFKLITQNNVNVKISIKLG